MSKYFFIFILIIITLFYSVALLPSFDEEVSFKTKVDRSQLNLGETLTFSIILTGRFETSPKIKLPKMKDFEVVSSGKSHNISILKGATEITTEFAYVLRPLRAGKLVIGPCELVFKNEVFSTIPIEVEALEEVGPPEIPSTETENERIIL